MPIKKTKRAQKIKVRTRKESYYIHSYQCPACRTIYEDTIGANVIRFRCGCGQELIVAERINT
jgi:predicted SprT family Zn-dependent metalloprotease